MAPGARGRSAKFNWLSRVAVWGMGPHSGGHKVSYTLYFKSTKENANMVLVHFGNTFGSDSKKNIFTLALMGGRPVLYSSSRQQLVASENLNLADGKWQHIAVSMPRKSCLLSQVHIYVNGERIKTYVNGDDVNLFFHTSGRISLGGFGHSHSSYDTYLKKLNPFQGWIDEFYLWARQLYPADLERAMKRDKSFNVTYGRKCAGPSPYKVLTGVPFRVCNKACLKDNSCVGYDYTEEDGGFCRLFQDSLTIGRWKKGTQCRIANTV